MVTFSHPYTSPTLTLVLRNPELGNAEQTERGLLFRKSMDGTLNTFIRTYEANRLLLTFVLLTNDDIDDLVTFIKTVRSNTFRYLDHETVNHQVKLPMSNYLYSWTGRYSRVIQLTLEEV